MAVAFGVACSSGSMMTLEALCATCCFSVMAPVACSGLAESSTSAACRPGLEEVTKLECRLLLAPVEAGATSWCDRSSCTWRAPTPGSSGSSHLQEGGSPKTSARLPSRSPARRKPRRPPPRLRRRPSSRRSSWCCGAGAPACCRSSCFFSISTAYSKIAWYLTRSTCEGHPADVLATIVRVKYRTKRTSASHPAENAASRAPAPTSRAGSTSRRRTVRGARRKHSSCV
mmetsp:Transcript_4119/g.12047  ORF Transcript_4119/g.12047 Transcript_4119/m.12047 type:complete len:229 (-) Transcript_4119:694-1380(-)